MGSQKLDTKKLAELLKQNAELKKELEAMGIKVKNLEDINAMSDEAQKALLREDYAKMTEGGIIIPPIQCGAGQHWDEAQGKCVDNAPPVGGGEKDKFGVLKIYADKSGGKNITEGYTEEEFERNYASGKPSEWSYECEYKSSDKLSDVESTFYCKINGFKSGQDTMSIKLLGPDHNDKSKGKWLIFQVDTDGANDDNFQIEDPHPKNHDNHQQTKFTIGTSIVGKWIGFKAITFKEGNDRKAYTYLDFPVPDIANPPNHWREYIAIDSVKGLQNGFVDATGGNVLLRIDGVKKGSSPETKYASLREITNQKAGSTVPPPEPEPEPEPPTTPPTTGGTLDKNGIAIPYTMTGKSVPLLTGNDHRNGQRYSVNHKFQNYCVVGYFKLGKGQEQIELKTDGPNHGGCTKLPQCCWCETDLAVADRTNQEGMKFKAGTSFISSEFPHPVNHSPPKDQVMPVIAGIKAQQWLGFMVCAYQDGEFRHIELRADVTPFDAAGKPNNTWQMGVNDVDRGQITTPELAKRKMAVDYDQGLEAEIRMHKGTNHDCEIKWANVYEIIPPV